MTFLPTRLVVTGALGRAGSLLRTALPQARLGGLPVTWHARHPGKGVDLAWDIGAEPPPPLVRGAVVLHLAGQTAGSADQLADNARSARLVAEWVAAAGGHLLLMSSAAVYAPLPRDLTEADAPAPASAYGRAKLEAELAARTVLPGPGLTALRLANLAGGDVLFGNIRKGQPITLDPIAGQEGGPLRSYIGPVSLARVLDGLVGQLAQGRPLPGLLNLAQPGAIAMADVLRAAGATWHFGPMREGAIARVTLDVGLLQSLTRLESALAERLVAEVAACGGLAR